MDKRLIKIINDKGRYLEDGCMLDTYNQQI